MCAHCTDANHEAPTIHDLTGADVDLFNHDARRPPHDVQTCETADCWVCLKWHRDEKAWLDARDERWSA